MRDDRMTEPHRNLSNDRLLPEQGTLYLHRSFSKNTSFVSEEEPPEIPGACINAGEAGPPIAVNHRSVRGQGISLR